MEEIITSKYMSTSGLATKSWGPSGWYFLFSCVMGGFPPKIDLKNKEHCEIKKHFKNMFTSLAYTMPCVYCRNSYKQFLEELPIDPFLTSRLKLLEWLYLIRNKVNDKLIKQEKKCYNDEKKRLKRQYHNTDKTPNDKQIYYTKLREFKKETFITNPSPPFSEVLDKYESIRATCSNRAKTCSIPKK